MQPGAHGRVQQADHSRYHTAFLHEIDNVLEDGLGIAIEAHDETALYLQSGVLERLDRGDQVAAGVLRFRPAEGFLSGTARIVSPLTRTAYLHVKPREDGRLGCLVRGRLGCGGECGT